MDDGIDDEINISDDSFERAMMELDQQDDGRKYNDTELENVMVKAENIIAENIKGDPKRLVDELKGTK